jgi:carbon monoxide dehydrogenase subunit G
MEIKKTFSSPFPVAVVWDAMTDIEFVAACLPGATITKPLGPGEYEGTFAVKLGPLAAAFAGVIRIDKQPEALTAVVTGKGQDGRSSSRVTASMTYRLSELATQGTQVDVVSDIALAGSLAQFGKAAVMQEVANRLTAEFLRNFEQRLEARAPVVEASGAADAGGTGAIAATAAPAPEPARQLNLLALLWQVLKARIGALFGRRSRDA